MPWTSTTIMASRHGRADYPLYALKRSLGVIETKPVGTSVWSGWRSAKYALGLSTGHCRVVRPSSEDPEMEIAVVVVIQQLGSSQAAREQGDE
jgi:hypothetical protein